MLFSLTSGLTLRQGQRTLELVRELPSGEWVLEDIVTRRPRVSTVSALIEDIYAKKYELLTGAVTKTVPNILEQPVVIDVSSLSSRERKLLELRLAYVKQLERMGISRGKRFQVQVAIQKIAQGRNETAPSASAVMHWMRAYQKSSNNVLSLIDKHRLSKRPRRVDPPLEELIWKALRKHYFTPACNSIQFAHDQLKIEIIRLRKNGESSVEDKDVSYPTLARRIRDVDLYRRISLREGPNRARLVCRTALPEGVASYPYQSAEVDHTPFNYIVVCDRTGLPLGRPILTVMIDSYSGYILGIYISFYGPGLTSVCGVIRNAVVPKSKMLTGLSLENEWMASGLPDEIIVDNGLEFHSFGFKSIAMTLGFDITYCRVRTPWQKPHVERFFESLNTLTLLKGHVNKSIANSSRIDPYKDAAITFSDFLKGILMYIVDVYPHTPNWRKMGTPHEIFQQGISSSPPVQYPGSLEQLKLATGMSRGLTLNGGGIGYLGLSYGSYAFPGIVEKHGSGLKLMCKWSPDDMQTLYVKDPVGTQWHEAQCRTPEYARGLSFTQHQMIRKFARLELSSPLRVETLLLAKQRLHDHWMDTTRGPNKRDSQKAAQYVDMTSAKILEPKDKYTSTPQNTHANSERLLTPQEIQIEESEIPEFNALSL